MDVRLGRRGFLGAAAAAGVAVSAPPAMASAAGDGGAVFRWLGCAGWRVDIGATTVLVDPFLSRFDTGLFRPPFDPATPLTVDESRIGEHAGDPAAILVTHTHWDHYADVPHIAAASAARVFGTLTAYHIGTAFGLPESQLSPVKGGEVLDFGDHTVEVVAALHSRNANHSLAFPGVRVAAPERPATIADLPEGDTLAYLLRVRGGPSVFFMGASDFVERNLTGLAPDVAMVAVPATDATADYAPRLLAALDHPRTVVPVHWDDFETEPRNPPPVAPRDRDRLDRFVRAVRAASPRTRVLLPDYLTPYRFTGR